MAPESAHFYRGLGCRLNVPDIWGVESPMKWPFSVNRFAWTFEDSVAPPVINETGEDGIALNINFVVPWKKPEPIDITPPTPDPYAGQPADPSLKALPSPP